MKRIADYPTTARFFANGTEISRAEAISLDEKNNKLLKLAETDILALNDATFIFVELPNAPWLYKLNKKGGN